MQDQEKLNEFPEWWYRNKRPPNDDVYFENLCRVIFQTGLNWQVVEKKWSSIRKAFYNFKVDKVASFTDSDVKRLLSESGRNTKRLQDKGNNKKRKIISKNK